MKKTATKKTKATAHPAPLIIMGPVPGTLTPSVVCDLLMATHTSKELTDLLRNRGIKIPKDKAEMADRLAHWAWTNHDRFTLSIGA
jgi:hypothetical protein